MGLLTSDVDLVWGIGGLSIDMIDRHMTHEEDESEPWHEVLLDILGNDICACGANK